MTKVIDKLDEAIKDLGFQDYSSLKVDEDKSNAKIDRVALKLDANNIMFAEHIDIGMKGYILLDFITFTIGFILLENEYTDETMRVITDENLDVDGAQKADENSNKDKEQKKPTWLDDSLNMVNSVQYYVAQQNLTETIPFSVEVLILYNAGSEVKAELNALALDTQILHYNAINVLAKDVDVKDVKDVKETLAAKLPWTLTNYKVWFDQHFPEQVKVLQPPQLQFLTGVNFRILGERKIEFVQNESECNFHIFHGHNGSGKSTLVEMIELIVRGKIKRLSTLEKERKLTEYRQILKNHDAHKDAQVSVTYRLTDDQENDFHIDISDELSSIQNINKEISPNSFILNQPLIDDLSRASETERFNILFNKIFKQDLESYKERVKLNDEVKDLAALLHANGLTLSTDINSLRAGKDEVWKQLVLLTQDDFRLLVRLEPKLQYVVDELDTSKISNIDEIQNAVENIQQEFDALNIPLNDILVNLNAVDELFKEIANYQLNQNVVAESYEMLFKEYCLLSAQVDLNEKQLLLHAVSTDKTLNDRDFQGTEVKAVKDVLQDVKQLAQKLKDLKEKKTKVKLSLQEYVSHPVEQGAQVPVALTASQIELLNRCGRWLQDHNKCSFSQLGDVLNKIILRQSTDERIPVENGAIQLESLQNQCEILSGIIERIERRKKKWRAAKGKITIPFGFGCGLKLCLRYAEAKEKIKEKEEKDQQNFVEILVEDNNQLAKAMLELLHLFTPAKWLYKDTYLNLDLAAAKLSLSIENEYDINLIWNTAELNLIAIVFFILCNIKDAHKRPINTTIMDDPIQNMDELTAKYFARGMARLQHFWKHHGYNNQLILLFHGEQVFLDFCRIIPAHQYHLPWISGIDKKPENSDEDGGKSNQDNNEVNKNAAGQIQASNSEGKIAGDEKSRKYVLELFAVKKAGVEDYQSLYDILPKKK